MHTHIHHESSAPDLQAIREFLLSGRDLPPAPPTKRDDRRQKPTSTVAFHNGIVRARSRSAAKD